MSAESQPKKNKLERIYACSVCNSEYTTSRYSTKRFCSDKCRKSSSRHKVASKRIEKLPLSEEWLFVASECKRAGTVEVMQGHTVETLEQLFSLRNYRYKCYGFDPERKVSRYHLCHIQPVSGNDSVGLLHPHNIFVGGSLQNQVHGTKSYDGIGLSISRYSLKQKWLVSKEDSDKDVLAKVEKYLGKVLVEYAKKNPIRISQRLSLAKWIHKNVPDCPHTLHELQRKGVQELRRIRATFEEKELYKMDVSTKRSFIVYLDECQRLSEQLPDCRHKADLAFMVPVLRVACAVMSLSGESGFGTVLALPFRVQWSLVKLRADMELNTFRDFLSFHSFQALQGAPVERSKILGTLRKYLCVGSMVPDWSHVPEGCYPYFSEEFHTFPPQIKPLQNAILSLELASPLMVHEFLESCKEAQREMEWFESHEWAVCESENDYSGVHYEVGDNYIPNPNLRTVRKLEFVHF